MQHKMIVLLLISLVIPSLAFADHPVPADHSTVHIVFIVPHATSGALEDSTFGNGSVPMANVGGLVVPIDSNRPVSISIDGEFVGHAMFGNVDIKPVFVLPSGLRKFTFACKGFKTTSAELKVLGTGSKQYLIVKLPVDSSDTDDADDSAASDATDTQPKG